jgi:hypothetical protein
MSFGTTLLFKVLHENAQKLEKRWEEESEIGVCNSCNINVAGVTHLYV